MKIFEMKFLTDDWKECKYMNLNIFIKNSEIVFESAFDNYPMPIDPRCPMKPFWERDELISAKNNPF